MHKWMLISGAIFALTSVLSGAFAAHGLKSRLDEVALGIFQTAAQYQMTHSIALILCGLFAFQLQQNQSSSFWLNLSALGFVLGIVFFSGSLYGLALTGQKWLGPITPIGGLLFILGWLSFVIAVVKS